MVAATLGEVLAPDSHQHIRIKGTHCIYVISNIEIALYVGKSNDPRARVREHYHSQSSAIGREMHFFVDDCKTWDVWFFTHAECKPIYEQFARAWSPANYQLAMQQWAADPVGCAEYAMIRHYQPIFNVMFNRSAE